MQDSTASAFPSITYTKVFALIPYSWGKFNYSLSIYIAFPLIKKKKKATEPFKKTLSNTDAIYLSSSEMINGITGALGEGYLYECLS